MKPQLAGRQHPEDGLFLERVWAFRAAEGVAHREQGERAADTAFLACDLDVFVVGGGVVVGVGGGVAVGEPGRGVGQRRGIVARVRGVVQDAAEGDVVVVGGVFGAGGAAVVVGFRGLEFALQEAGGAFLLR